jgi:hypothetical protein
VRKFALVPLLLLVLVLGLAACGGGSGSSGESGSTSAAGPTPEAKWAKEVDKIMRGFENHVSARATEAIHTTGAQRLLEPLYRSYGAALTKLGDHLEATDTPPTCVAMRKRMADDGHALGQLTTKLGHEPQADEEEFASLVVVQQSRIHRYGSDLTEITATPHC